MALAAGLEIVAESDRSEVVAGEEFHRGRAKPVAEKKPAANWDNCNCCFRQSQSTLPPRTPKKHKKFTVTHRLRTSRAETPWELQQPEPPSLAIAKQEVTVAGHKFAEQQPVTHIAATSTRIDRVPVRMVPAYTLAVEPDQTIELLARPKKPFDVLTHAFILTPPSQARSKWASQCRKAGQSVRPSALQFSGASDQYAKLTVTPPTKLSAGTYPLTAFAQRGKEKFSTSLAPLPSMPTLLWSQPAQCRVFAFDANVPDDLRVGYISAESEPIPQALERLGIQVEMLDAAALAFSNLVAL